ncbi:procollagen-lysine,2-oxoglutarate 5-dioxygenase 1-like [Anneissia japonica]|uniref:procollagen-lysine,2-oxoglutarate 5-dioxygenase 1-like n=1 Tax=Anneissia japonica TaxID=1529436 RepID=UPI0014256AF7|nr:procollagen-lysine,2-oxoglutarate 5-dioxygenase 1-like [Anneissia japonica]
MAGVKESLCRTLICVFIVNLSIVQFTNSTSTETFENFVNEQKVVVFTVATNETDGFLRYWKSCHQHDIKVQVLGMHKKWTGGDIQWGPGGGQKINLFIEALKKYKDESDTIILFTDSYDVIFVAGLKEIIRKFKDLDSNVVFGAENLIWPDKSLRHVYPKVEGYRFLNSGLIIGYADYIWKSLTYKSIVDAGDDQLFFTKLYLDEKLRSSWKIKLDTEAYIFQNLNGATQDVKVKFLNDASYLHNAKYNTLPSVIHGNGPSKLALNLLGNYLNNHWTLESGCKTCDENTFSLHNVEEEDLPQVLMAIFIEQATPFIAQFFDGVLSLDYPKNKIDLFIHNNEMYHFNHVNNFTRDFAHQYASLKYIQPAIEITEGEARQKGIEYCGAISCDYYLSIDSPSQIHNPRLIKILIEQNRTVLAPMFTKYGRLWSNFWGALNEDNYYARSEDYVSIVRRQRLGVFNVPYISSVYIIHGHLLRGSNAPSFIEGDKDSDMNLCANMRSRRERRLCLLGNQGDSEVDFCYDLRERVMLDSNSETRKKLTIISICSDWERLYLRPDYWDALKEDAEIESPCPDVYRFPLISELYAKHMIEELNAYGQWSNGDNKDPRLDGGYENVPTRDIHMNQIGFEKHWLFLVKNYVAPIQERLYPGYFTKAFAVMNFVVRYKPDEQPFLRPHHDSSTFTLNVALNRRGIDYEGGGCRFLRYNCSVTDSGIGQTLIHPGRLTHYHEGLLTTKGIRYIMVSFVDP